MADSYLASWLGGQCIQLGAPTWPTPEHPSRPRGDIIVVVGKLLISESPTWSTSRGIWVCEGGLSPGREMNLPIPIPLPGQGPLYSSHPLLGQGPLTHLIMLQAMYPVLRSLPTGAAVFPLGLLLGSTVVQAKQGS